jgi:thioredoxin
MKKIFCAAFTLSLLLVSLATAAVSHLDDSNFESSIKEHAIVVLDFYADWCGPCKKFSPTFTSVSNQMDKNILFAKVDSDKAPQTANKYQVRTLPTVVILKNGSVVKKGNPPQTIEGFKSFVESAIK